MTDLNMETSVAVLPGCGKATVQKLNANGIYTCKQLLNHRGEIPNVNTEQLKSKIKQDQYTSKEIDQHNWMNQTVHIALSKGTIVRCKVGSIVIAPHSVLMNVTWMKMGKTMKKPVSPVVILCTSILWFSNDVISDDSDADIYTHPLNRLPKLRVHSDNPILKKLNQSELSAIHVMIKETNQLYNCINRQTV